MTPPELPANMTSSFPVNNDTQWPRDGTASIASQLKSGYNHAVSAAWQSERHLHKVNDFQTLKGSPPVSYD